MLSEVITASTGGTIVILPPSHPPPSPPTSPGASPPTASTPEPPGSPGAAAVAAVAGVCPSSRAWCLCEWGLTLAAHGPDGLHLRVEDVEQRARLFGSINLMDAKCSLQADKVMIVNMVRRGGGRDSSGGGGVNNIDFFKDSGLPLWLMVDNRPADWLNLADCTLDHIRTLCTHL